MTRRPELARDLNLWHSAALVVGIIIGSGIFLVPRKMMAATGSVDAALGAWVVGGLLTWFGALTYAELGAMKPGSGGEYVFLRDAYGPLWGFLYAWDTFLVAKPASIATVAVGVVRILGEFPAFAWTQSPLGLGLTAGHAVAVAMVLLFSAVNWAGVKRAGDFQLVSTALKVAMICGIIAVGFSWSGGSFARFKTAYDAAPGGMNGFMAALIAALWAYDGWNNLLMVAGEIEEPERVIPRALILGVSTVAALYILTFLSVQYVLPAGEVALAPRPASLAVMRVLGPAGAFVVSAGIAFSMFVTINGQILTGARIPFAAARDGYFFESLASVHPRFRTPGPSIAFQAALTVLLVLLGGAFEDLLNLAIFSEWLFYALVAGSIFVYRRRDAAAARPYRCWGYPAVPALFIAAACVLLAYSFFQGLHPDLQAAPALLSTPRGWGLFLRSNSFWGAAVIAAGVPVFRAFASVGRGASTP